MLYRWCPEEWWESDRKDFVVPKEAAASRKTVSLSAHAEPFYDEYPDESYGIVFAAAMTLALRDVDKAGLFATRTERDSLLVFSWMRDTEDGLWMALESARLLNSPKVYEAFSTQWLTWQIAADRKISLKPATHRKDEFETFRSAIKVESWP
jgi:hypothetical protein